MNKLLKTIPALIILMIIGVLLLPAACSNSPGEINPALRPDNPAPDFQLQDIDGQTVSLSSFQGQVVFLNFWSTTCPACVSEMPYIQAIHDEWLDRGLAVLTINIGEAPATVQRFLQENQYTFPVLLDSRYEVAGKYNIRYLPTNIFIDQEGRTRSIVVGAFKTRADIEKQFAGLIR